MTAVQPLHAPQPVRLTVEDFALLHESGSLDRVPRAELIEGIICTMNPQLSRHAAAKSRLAYRLTRAFESLGLPMEAVVEVSVALPPHNVPQPDIVVTIVPEDNVYVPGDAAAIVVEISESTAAFDLGKKAQIYAAHALPEYWVVELPKARIHQFWSPSGTSYQERRIVPFGAPLASTTIPDLVVPTEGLI